MASFEQPDPELSKPRMPMPYLPVTGMSVVYIDEAGHEFPALVAGLSERKNLALIVFSTKEKNAEILLRPDVTEQNEAYPTNCWRFPDFVTLWQRPHVY